MKVALLTLDFSPEPGGVQRYLFEIACRLGQTHDVVVVTTTGGPLDPVPFRRIVVSDTSVWSWVHWLRTLKPDRVLVGHAHPRLLLSAALCAWGRYATFTYGNDYLVAQRRWHRLPFNWLLGHSRPLITIAEDSADRLLRLGLPFPVIARPGIDTQRFCPAPAPPPQPLTLLTVGRLVSRKGIDRVLEALAVLLAEFPDLRYRIVGDGPDRQRLESLASELGVGHAVTFLGRVPDEALPSLYRQAHIFVMPAREERDAASVEGFGIVYLEASASGLAVVAARSGGVSEAVRAGETGRLVPPDDPEALVRALRALIVDGEERERLGCAGRRWTVEEMGWEQTARSVLGALGPMTGHLATGLQWRRP